MHKKHASKLTGWKKEQIMVSVCGVLRNVSSSQTRLSLSLHSRCRDIDIYSSAIASGTDASLISISAGMPGRINRAGYDFMRSLQIHTIHFVSRWGEKDFKEAICFAGRFDKKKRSKLRLLFLVVLLTKALEQQNIHTGSGARRTYLSPIAAGLFSFPLLFQSFFKLLIKSRWPNP